MGVPLLIGYVLDKYCIISTESKMIEGKMQLITNYDYSIPMLIFAAFGFVGILFAFLLKKEDKKMGYGLELPNVKE
jgi:hypothetical protein